MAIAMIAVILFKIITMVRYYNADIPIVKHYPNFPNLLMLYGIGVAEVTVFGCCDFIAQCILVRTANNTPFISFIYASKIHRCWIVWGRNIRVIIVPSILAFAFLCPSSYLDPLADRDLLPLGMWMAGNGAGFIVQNQIDETAWGTKLTLTSLTTSMTVNALVTGLIVFKIFKVFREVKSVTTSEDRSLGITRGNKLRSVTFIIIESGTALFAVQLARVVSSSQFATGAAYNAFRFIIGIHEMVNVIISSVIVILCLLITSI